MKRPPYGLSVPITLDRVVDGDTVRVRLLKSERVITVRLLDLWCHELRRGPEADREKGRAARDFVKTRLEAAAELSLFIPTDLSDPFAGLTMGRVLGHIFVTDDRTISECVVQHGLGTKEKPI